MTNTTLDLVPLIRSGDFAALREELVRRRPRELADAIGELTPEDQVIAFRILPHRRRCSPTSASVATTAKP